MKELIERLQNATGPDRKLDAEIAYVTKPALQRCGPLEGWLKTDASTKTLNYTWSIDDAVMTVPKWHTWSVGCGRLVQYVARVTPVNGNWGFSAGECDSTPAIALCIAALKARAAHPPQKGEQC